MEEGEPLTKNGMARLLKGFGIKSKQVRSFNAKGYERAPIEDAYNRYCTPKDEEVIEGASEYLDPM